MCKVVLYGYSLLNILMHTSTGSFNLCVRERIINVTISTLFDTSMAEQSQGINID